MTKQIELTQGKFALVDDKDFDELNKRKWCANKRGNTYYAVTDAGGYLLQMHRHILGLTKGDGKSTDHRNGNGFDNRRSNLRVISHMENMHNRKLSARNTSGHAGVYWSKETKKWLTQITINYKTIHLGYFDTILDAVKAREKGEAKYWNNH